MLAPVLLAAILAGVYLVWDPASADLAAQTFRADVFADHGFAIWNNDWYGGHYLTSYSVLFPPLGGTLGVRLAGALAAVAAAALFAAIAQRRYGDRARLGALWFALASATLLLTGRLTFALGVAVGLAALLALQRRRRGLAIVLAAACSLASPVAGFFLAIAATAVATGGHDRRGGAAVAITAGLVLAVLSVAFPTGGTEPFVLSAFIPIPLLAGAALILLPPEERVLRHGAMLYFAAALGALLIASPVGGTVTRLGALCAGPIFALVLTGRRWVALAVVGIPLLYWQWTAPVRDVATAAGDPSTQRSYYEPLLAELGVETAGKGIVRLEIPPTRNRWESAYVAPDYPLARGWLRQVEWGDRRLFTHGRLAPDTYRDWLDRNGISYVAVSNAKRDYLAMDEVRLIRAGLPYLDRIWSNESWQLYRVEAPVGLASPPGRIVALEPDSFTLRAPRAGTYLVRFGYTRYWTITSGDACVSRAGDWTHVEAREPGRIEVSARFSLGRMVDGDGSCSG